MSNWARSICTMLYYQCQTVHDLSAQCLHYQCQTGLDLSVQCFTINVKLHSIHLYNALLSMSNICTMLYYQCQTALDPSVQCFTINVKLGSIYLYNALLSMSNWTRSVCNNALLSMLNST